MRAVVIDDSGFMRRAVERMLAEDPEIEVVGRGRNGLEAIELAKTLEPDVMTLDIEMPEMDGLTALRRIMREAPCKVVMVSSLTTEGSVAALRALRLGAADVVAKDHSTFSIHIDNIRDELVGKVKGLAQEAKRTRAIAKPAGARATAGTTAAAAHDGPAAREVNFTNQRFDLICIGSSTGGPPVLERVLPTIPAGFSTPIVIAQHMPEVFTQSMSRRLNELCPLEVRHGADGDEPAPGTITICPGGKHTHVKHVATGRHRLHVTDEPAADVFKPSASVLFESAAKACNGPVLGVVLTGIGEDGKRGAQAIRDAGGTVLSQSADTCVVYGMPRAVDEAGLSHASVTPEGLGRALASLARAAAA
ncbi:MAG: chemotaxis response regulator protein-glutamate methylesterase [Planctomycetota bacterium]